MQAAQAAAPRFERRRRSRRIPSADEPLARVRLRTGWELTVVDVSNGGALVEGFARLLPGTHLDVHVITPEGRVLVRSRVVRACVCAVTADSVRYRGAFAFEREADTSPPGYVLPSTLANTRHVSGSDYPAGSDSQEAAPGERVRHEGVTTV